MLNLMFCECGRLDCRERVPHDGCGVPGRAFEPDDVRHLHRARDPRCRVGRRRRRGGFRSSRRKAKPPGWRSRRNPCSRPGDGHASNHGRGASARLREPRRAPPAPLRRASPRARAQPGRAPPRAPRRPLPLKVACLRAGVGERLPRRVDRCAVDRRPRRLVLRRLRFLATARGSLRCGACERVEPTCLAALCEPAGLECLGSVAATARSIVTTSCTTWSDAVRPEDARISRAPRASRSTASRNRASPSSAPARISFAAARSTRTSSGRSRTNWLTTHAAPVGLRSAATFAASSGVRSFRSRRARSLRARVNASSGNP